MTTDAVIDARLRAMERETPASADFDERALFDDLRAWVTRFVALGDDEATAIALWVMMTHAINAFECVPYLSVTSAEKQCGKTRLLEVLELVVARPWLTGRTTPAVLARKIDAEQPTLLLDESDATFGGDKEFAQALRGVLNTGYLRSGKTSLCVTRGKAIEFADFSTFGAKAIAGIGSLPDTVADRSIRIRLQRKLPGESVERFRRRKAVAHADGIRSRLQTWAQAFGGEEHPEPNIPDELPDRAADIAESLLAIAESCGDDVAASARIALVGLCGRHREDESLGVRLLLDVRAAFDESGEDRLASANLAARLAAIEESPWAPRFGRDFDARALAKLLKPFAIRPRGIRLADDTTPRGYHRDDFADAWARFAPAPGKAQPLQQAQQAYNVNASRATAFATTPPRGAIEPQQSLPRGGDSVVLRPLQQVAEPQREKPHAIKHVAVVADVAGLGNGGRCDVFVVATLDGDGRLAACLDCGGTWELHGSPPSSEWRTDNDGTDYFFSYADDRITAEASPLTQAEFVL